MKKVVYLSLFLAIVGILSALVLTVVNDQTKVIIENAATEKQKANLGSMFPGDVTFKELALAGKTETIESVVEVQSNGAVTAYAFTVKTSGYGGEFKYIVGINADGTYAGFSALDHKETPGFGAAMTEEKFTSQFAQTSIDSNIDGITGATKTTNAIFKGLDEVLAYYEANFK